jgi:hypothetical protein
MDQLKIHDTDAEDVRLSVRLGGAWDEAPELKLTGTIKDLIKFVADLAENGQNGGWLAGQLADRVVVEQHPDPYFRATTQVYRFAGVVLLDDEDE